MQTTSFGDQVEGTNWDYLLHNRLNFEHKFNDSFRFNIELRNRLFAGQSVTSESGFSQLVDHDNGAIDLTWLVVNTNDMVGVVQVDRAWFEYKTDNWQLSAGRQRVNWGINLYWNNNDLFNTYSLVEFDYEERPGSDAVRVTRLIGDERWIEAAIKVPANDSDFVAALRYAFTLNRYDIKILGGTYKNEYVAGLGWEGNIGNVGFKGESAVFVPEDPKRNTTVSISVSGDYYFPSKLFLTGGYLYQNLETSGITAENIIDRFANGASPKRLMPFDHNFIANAGYPITPLLNVSLMATWSPEVNASFIMNSFSYSIAENWEAAVFGQFFVWYKDEFHNPVNSIFLRVKASF